MKLNAVWFKNTKGNGRLRADQLKTEIAIPEALGGSGQGAHPKELLVSSAATCYMMTLVYMLETLKLPIAGFIMDSELLNSKQTGLYITHYPKVLLSSEASEDQIQAARKAVVNADEKCEIGNLLKKAGVQIEIEGYVSLISEEDVISGYTESHGLDW